jgi:hypothetical protein
MASRCIEARAKLLLLKEGRRNHNEENHTVDRAGGVPCYRLGDFCQARLYGQLLHQWAVQQNDDAGMPTA